LPELVTGGAVALATAIGRMLGLRPIARIRAIKRGVFDLGALIIDLESCEADNRAYKEALARRKAIEEMRNQEFSDGFRSGSTTGPAVPSRPPAKRRRRTRSSSPRSGRTKPAPSPTDRTPT
jgi:hypothetical protein